jgi:hypothetical protein
MEPLGWIFMLVSVGAVWISTIWCFWKVLSLPPAEEAEVAKDVKGLHTA